MAGLDRGDDFRVRQVHALGIAGRRIGVEHEAFALRQRRGTGGEAADAQLRPLQIDQDADRPIVLGLDRADRRHQFAHARMRGVAHVDAEDVGARAEQISDRSLVGGRRTEGGDDLRPAQTSHQLRLRDGGGVFGCLAPPGGVGTIGMRDCNGVIGAWSADSVNCTVQDG